MNNTLGRRRFLELGAASALGAGMIGTAPAQTRPASRPRTVRLGVIGTGGRGRSLMGLLLRMPGVEIPAVCDINPAALAAAQDDVQKAGQPRPEGYGDGPEAYRQLVRRDDLDAVLIATPWDLHTPMAVAGMRAGKYVAVEVPAAITLEQCWDLVHAHEETGKPCMMLENWSFRRDNLAVLNMIRAGLFGEIVHCHCAHSHDCVDHWYFDTAGNIRWGGEFLVKRNADQYPTHSLGPVLSWMDINCGDTFETVVSMATRSLGINAHFARKFGPDHPNARRKYAQGDIVTTLVKTARGNTIVINMDMQLPRPYDNRWMIQGTLGLYDEPRNSVYILGTSPRYHEWEPFAPYQEKYEHRWWRQLRELDPTIGHGGTDYIELDQFLRAVRAGRQTPIDVYDSVMMSVITPLSERSIAEGSRPVRCPDFTRGAWQTRKPTFGI